MLIRIISGIYGRHVGHTVEAVRPGDPPFEVADEEALRLIALKVAAPVDGAVVGDPTEGEADDEFGYSMDNTKAQLLAIAGEYGVDVDPKATKAQIIAALDAVFAAPENPAEDAGTGEEPPAMTPEAPVV